MLCVKVVLRLSQQCPVALKGLRFLVVSKIQLFWKDTTSLEGEKGIGTGNRQCNVCILGHLDGEK